MQNILVGHSTIKLGRQWKTAASAIVQLCEYENQTLEAIKEFCLPVQSIGTLRVCGNAANLEDKTK